MFLTSLVILVIVQVIGHFWAKRYDMSKKVDRGIEFCYWKLSYRRKFIRTLWLIPVFMLIIIGFYQTFQSYMCTWIVGIMLFASIMFQAVYNYRKWKDENQ